MEGTAALRSRFGLCISRDEGSVRQPWTPKGILVVMEMINSSSSPPKLRLGKSVNVSKLLQDLKATLAAVK